MVMLLGTRHLPPDYSVGPCVFSAHHHHFAKTVAWRWGPGGHEAAKDFLQMKSLAVNLICSFQLSSLRMVMLKGYCAIVSALQELEVFVRYPDLFVSQALVMCYLQKLLEFPG